MLLADRYRRQAHTAAWYTSPDDEPSNLPISLPNPFGKRRAPTRNNNTLHAQEEGHSDGRDGRALRPIRTDGQDYRPTTPLDRQRELGLGDQKPHSATTPNAASAMDNRNEKMDIPRSDSPVNGLHSTDKVETVTEQRLPDSTSSETAVENETANKSPVDVNNEGTHQRKTGAMAKVKGLFRKKSDKTDGDDDENGKNKPKQTFTPMSQVRATILNSWINVLLIACECHSSYTDLPADHFQPPSALHSTMPQFNQSLYSSSTSLLLFLWQVCLATRQKR